MKAGVEWRWRLLRLRSDGMREEWSNTRRKRRREEKGEDVRWNERSEDL